MAKKTKDQNKTAVSTQVTAAAKAKKKTAEKIKKQAKAAKDAAKKEAKKEAKKFEFLDTIRKCSNVKAKKSVIAELKKEIKAAAEKNYYRHVTVGFTWRGIAAHVAKTFIEMGFIVKVRYVKDNSEDFVAVDENFFNGTTDYEEYTGQFYEITINW